MNNRMTINELYVFFWIAYAIIAFFFQYLPIVQAAYQFTKISDYSKHGYLLTYNSTLRIPDDIVKTKQLAAYCKQIKDLRYPNKIIVNYSVSDGPYKGAYCGCLPEADKPDSVNYKLVNKEIIYHCQDEIYSTTLIPASLKGK